MVISSNTNLIPCDQRHYPVQPYVPKDTIMMIQDSVAHHYRFKRSPADKMTAAIPIGNQYDSHQCLHFADDYQVGRLVDLYA